MAGTPKPFFVAGRAQTAPGLLAVLNKHKGAELATVCVPTAEAVDRALTAAVGAVDALRTLPAYRRSEALFHVARRLRERAEEVARIVCGEVGKPIGDARNEVARAIDTLRLSGEEATRLTGEYLPLDSSARGENTEAIVKRVPAGVCSFITPFNFPLNLAAHKIGPALAAGCPFVLKPDPRTPLSALVLAEMLAETDLPAGSFSVLPVTDETARDMFVTDERIRVLSFTGSSRVGWELRSRAGNKKVLLELGGNAACIIDAPISRTDLERIADRVCYGCFALAGQSCISVQRILVQRTIYDAVLEAIVSRAKQIRAGDPLDESTAIGPMISVEAAERVERWIDEAVKAGALIRTGGQRVGAFMEPTLVENAPAQSKLVCDEVFGPVAVIQPFDSFDEALASINAGKYGLQTGVFTASLTHALRAWNVLNVGGVIVNDVPSSRMDAMPYGGVKESGLGREGVRYAVQEFTELRTLVLRNVGRPRREKRDAAAGSDPKGDSRAILSDSMSYADAKSLSDTAT
ncbi:MAG: aldehyde dehydrogenase family protein [Planctomycetota bacterium]|nr:aldehyde dehydrogenase family protein [Planctomycetota bacterium]